MNQYFSKVIKTEERQREFNFREISAAPEARYSVDVPDDKGMRLMFSMILSEEGQWRTAAPSLPSWIREAEASLGEAIEEHRHQDQEPPKRSFLGRLHSSSR